jgi:hypothetical protein
VLKQNLRIAQKQLARVFVVTLISGCGKQNNIPPKAEPTAPPTYQAHALLHFQGGEGQDALLPNQVKKLQTNEFKVKVEEQFNALWVKQDSQVADEHPPSHGKYNFEPTEGSVTLTAEAFDPNVAIVTANAVAQAAVVFYLDNARQSANESVALLEGEAEKQMKGLKEIDQEIRETRRKMDTDEQLKILLNRREEEEKVVNGIREKIEDERLKHDQNVISVHILERAEKAFEK